MKKLLLLLPLLLIGCTDESNDSAVNNLRSELRSTKYELESCQNRLNSLSTTDTGGFNNHDSTPQAEETTPNEPKCETTEYDEIYVDGRLLATCLSENVEVEACGIKAQGCIGDYSYYCLQNVKIKFVTKETCE